MRVSTSILRRVIVRIDTRCYQGVSVEHDCIALEDSLVIYQMLGRHYLESQHDDTVATINGNERVVVRALCAQHRVTELVGVSLADSNYDCLRCMGNRQYGYLQPDRRLFAFSVNDGVTIDTGLIDSLSVPYVGQVVCTDGYGIIEEAVNRQLQLNDTIATIRAREEERIIAGCLVVLALEFYRITFEDRMINYIMIGLEYIEVEDDHTIATDCIDERVAVFAAYREVTSVERITAALADLTIDRGIARLTYVQLETVEHPFSVDERCVVAICTG